MAANSPLPARSDLRSEIVDLVESLALVVGIVYRPVDPSFRALSGRLELTVRRHDSNKCSLPLFGVWGLGGNASRSGNVFLGFRVSGFRVQDSGFRVQGSGSPRQDNRGGGLASRPPNVDSGR